jgi:hypothetical protein
MINNFKIRKHLCYLIKDLMNNIGYIYNRIFHKMELKEKYFLFKIPILLIEKDI